jgi:tetratricopeptide (TPR) repeat protein
MNKMKSFKPRMHFLYGVLLTVCILHTPAYTQECKSLTDKVYKNGILQEIDSLIECKYVIAEKSKEYADEFKKIYMANRYASLRDAKEFAERVTADLQTITNDKHICLRKIESSDIGEKSESSLHHSIRFLRLRMKENTGFYKLEWIHENIGYMELRRFYSIAEAKDMITAAMRFLSNANAIIIDIRENGGGSGDYLSSYFLKYPTQLNSCYYRYQDYTEEFWTSKDIESEPLTDVPLFILTGRNTFSAAESFAYDLQARGRAVLVGDSTKGGAHSVDLFKIDDQFEINISTSRAINPVTGENWEGIGVIPDIQVPSETALDTAIALADQAAKEFAESKNSKLKAGLDEMQDHLNHAEKYFSEKKSMEANSALDSVFSIGGKLGLLNEFFIYVLAYDYYSNKNEEILFAVLEKSIKLFPDSSTAFETLAGYCYNFGKKDLALKYYRKVLKLNPDNTNAQRRLKELEVKK